MVWIYLHVSIKNKPFMWVKVSNLTWMIWIWPSHFCQDFSDQNSKWCFWGKNPRVRVEHQPDKKSRLHWFELIWWWFLSVFQADICFWMMMKKIRLNQRFSVSFCEFGLWANKVFLVNKSQRRCMQVLLLRYCWLFRHPAKQLAWNSSKQWRLSNVSTDHTQV